MRAKNAMSTKALAGKFSACSSKNPEINELFIVEGDRRGTKQGRDRNFLRFFL